MVRDMSINAAWCDASAEMVLIALKSKGLGFVASASDEETVDAVGESLSKLPAHVNAAVIKRVRAKVAEQTLKG